MNNINKPKIGRYIEQKEGFKAFTPFDFPPKGGFEISPQLYKKHEEAIRLVGKLDGITRLLPDKDFFISMFVAKDATYSSQIEGTKATLQDAVAAPVTEEKIAKFQMWMILSTTLKPRITVLKEQKSFRFL